jgi:hypothetical protein
MSTPLSVLLVAIPVDGIDPAFAASPFGPYALVAATDGQEALRARADAMFDAVVVAVERRAGSRGAVLAGWV